MVKDQRSPRMVSRTKAIPEYALLAPKYSYNLLSSQFKYVHNILSHEFEIKALHSLDILWLIFALIYVEIFNTRFCVDMLSTYLLT